MQFQNTVDAGREELRRPYFIVGLLLRPLGRELLQFPQMRRGQVNAPPVAPRYQRRGHEGAAHRKRGTRDRRVPGHSRERLRVDQKLSRVRNKRACSLVRWASRAARQAHERCGHVVTPTPRQRVQRKVLMGGALLYGLEGNAALSSVTASM